MDMPRTMRLMLIASLILNVILAAGMLWMGFTARRAMLNIMSEQATTELALQEDILDDLLSGDPQKIEDLKAKLRVNIDVAKRMRYRIDTQDLDF